MHLKRFLLFVLLIIGSFLMINSGVEAASGTTPIKKSDGTDLKYRNSSETVLRLTEYTYPTQDLRGVWISNYVGDIASYSSESQFKAEVKSVLDLMEEYGLNAMVFHIRIHNDAMYDSDLNPRRSYWKNVNFEVFDPLTYLIEESHKRGIEFHAWLNPYRVVSSGYDGTLESFALNYRNTYPEFANNPAGDASLLLRMGDNGIILNPGEPRVREHIYETIQEIIDKYDVDAIHFDDYFYNSINDSEDNVTYNKPNYNPHKLNKADWRREQVNLLMAGIDKLLDEHFEKTGKIVQLGISPTGIYKNSLSGTAGQEHFSSLYCDSVAWIQNEWVDYLMPQTYWGLEHITAGFAQLTRFWSSAAEGYNVNLYMAHGIYMAPGSGWTNPDEIKNRFLNLEMYDRIDGNCFYKFSYFKDVMNAAEQLKRGLPLLKNDYYAKKVPGSVVRSYADKVDSLKVNNLSVTKKTSTMVLSWDQMENVRGYVVYAVPKGQTLDKNNIDHLYKYIQTNNLEVPLNANTDYYVSSVNMANVVSEAVLAGEVLTGSVEGVIKGIDSLKDPVSLADEGKVLAIRGFYEALTPAEKAQIANYEKLVKAESQILALKEMRSALQEVIQRTSRHVVTDYVFPTNTAFDGTVAWRFKNPNEAVHDLVSGTRLKEILSAYPVTLVASFAKDNLVYEEEVVVNFGITKVGETPLFYRNSPSSMTKDEEGPYNEASHIGWSGKVLRLNNYVFFIAQNNYLPLTSSDVPGTYWVSCATLYHNVTESDIVIRAGDTAIITDIAGYGYLIIDANGSVRVSSLDRDPNAMITLKPNELLLAVRYLDSQLTNPVFVPIDKVEVGTKIEFTDYTALRTDPLTQAEQVMAMIDALPNPEDITTETDVLPFALARDAYEALSSEAKALVANLAKLENGERKIRELQEQALNDAKQNALSELNRYEDSLSLYSDANQQRIRGIIDNAAAQIQSAQSITQVQALIESALALLEDIPTIEEETALLNEHKVLAKETLSKYLNLGLYSDIQKADIDAYLAEAYEAIDQAGSIDEVNAIVADSKELLDLVPTVWDEAKTFVATYVEDLSVYSEVDQRYIEILIERSLNNIEQAETKAEVEEIIATFKSWIDALSPIDYEAMRSAAKSALDTYVKPNKYTEENRQAVLEIIEKAKAEIDSATTQEAIDEIVANAKAAIDAIPKKAAGLNCRFGGAYLYILIAAVGVVLIGLRKKRY
ncbi:MAG: hypothetical protein BWX94_01470 [Tenericutes bacterium ADurb.Bin140]|nr:MAG: hypothetical protein BWX94_01470 [Tenericutes bacterium ADurb.Bin140]